MEYTFGTFIFNASPSAGLLFLQNHSLMDFKVAELGSQSHIELFTVQDLSSLLLLDIFVIYRISNNDIYPREVSRLGSPSVQE